MQLTSMQIGDTEVPAYVANTVIVGSGAAGMNCAVHLYEFMSRHGIADAQERILVVTRGIGLGASRMSGSDKQTYYKMGTSPRVSDNAVDFAQTLTMHGCMHGDLALAEANSSLREFYHLVQAGVPFPHDPEGAFLGYKTDHDPYERATSAGPKTSRFMSECLQAQADRYGIPILDRHEVLELVTVGDGDQKRVVAVVTLDKAKIDNNACGMTVFVAENYVLAAGGPGEMYHTTVYPEGQVGMHGTALKAGLAGNNLTESQFGLASIQFRWNVSGTYMQVVPRLFSTDADGGDEQEFLCPYFDTMSTMATNIFLKGYQWPFDAQRITDQQSSLIDMVVHQERVVRGRRVFMDFLRDPVPGEGLAPFRLDELGTEALVYLQRTGALQELPIQRLAHMNPPAIEIYQENGIDLQEQPLEIAVCAQHNNGGFAVNKWWESTIRHTFVIGEMAGTHGVKRPGGSALNSGQAGGLRAAQYITHVYGADLPDLNTRRVQAEPCLQDVLRDIRRRLAKGAAATRTPEQAKREIQMRMTRFGAQLRERDAAQRALADAVAQYHTVRRDGLRLNGRRDLVEAVLVEAMCLTHVAYLKAIVALFERGAGSRGSHAILDPAGTPMHAKLRLPDTGEPYRFVPENESLRQTVLEIVFNPEAPDLFEVADVEVRPTPIREIAFEPAWTEYREGTIFRV